MKPWIFVTLLAVSAWSSCSTVDSRLQKDPAQLAAFPERDRALIRKGEIDKGFTEQEVILAKGEPSSKQTNWKGDREHVVWTYTRSTIEQAPSAPGGDSMATPFGYPVPGPQPLQTQPTVVGEMPWLVVEFIDGRVTEWHSPNTH